MARSVHIHNRGPTEHDPRSQVYRMRKRNGYVAKRYFRSSPDGEPAGLNALSHRSPRHTLRTQIAWEVGAWACDVCVAFVWRVDMAFMFDSRARRERLHLPPPTNHTTTQPPTTTTNHPHTS